MSTEQSLAKGTRVEITDKSYAYYGRQGEIADTPSPNHSYVEVRLLTEHIFRPDQLRVIEQPEPTIGQLVDAMHQEIERVCERMGWILLAVDLQSGFNPSKHQASIQILGRGWIDCTGDTPQAALRAMIERLREIKA
jgi:hypothetical protein